MKKLISFILAAMMVFSLVPAAAFAKTEAKTENTRYVNSGIVIDDNSSGGYEGDYVVIYNPSTSSSSSYSTGTMTGLIETSVGTSSKAPVPERTGRDALTIIDVDGLIAERERKENPDYGKIEEEGGTRASYTVGSTRNFTISSYSPGSSSLKFKVLAVGEHCYIWTPYDNVTNYYTLDSINADYGQQAADEFDRMYDLMNTSFGSHNNGSNGDGKVSLLFYNIDDGWSPDDNSGFIAGYFSSASYSSDGLPIINIDTYPGVYYTYNGVDYTSMDTAYGTACHEYQHCINYSNTSGMSTWLNECFSAAAEEICYPGSSIVSRIQSWENYYFRANNDWLNPPTEHEYSTSYTNLHKGYSMYGWSNNITDVLALYAQVSFFAQYLYTQYGNGIYKQISQRFSSSETTAITNATGKSCSDLVRDFRVAVTANATETDYNGIYGFKPQAGYDPSLYHDVENPYSLLAPVVFTGTSCSIKGGGAICVKPVNGVYNPPSGASSNLKYIGITLNNEPDPIESVTLEDISVTTGSNTRAVLTVTPRTADYTVSYASSNTNIATVDENGVVYGVRAGTATLTATVHDNVANQDLTASATVTVNDFEGYVLTSELEVGGKYVIAIGSYAVGNTVYNNASNGHYVTAQSVTINSDDTCTIPSSISENSVVWEITSGNSSDGFVLRNVENSKYLCLTSDQYVTVGTTELQWLYTGTDLNNQVDTDGYYYLSLGSNSTYFTTSKNAGQNVKFYKLVSASSPEPDQFVVRFLDWDGTVLKEQTVNEGEAATAPADPTREGYTFTGWDTDFSNVTSDLTVTAQYAINVYTVTFRDWDSTLLGTAQVEHGGTAAAPETPVREGYEFTGWSSSLENITADKTVYALYDILKYTVTFVDWDGTVLKEQIVNHGGYATAPDDPEREGYTFTGWDVDFSIVTSDLIVTATYAENPVTGMLGDVNNDGQINVTDALLIMRHAMNIITLTDEEYARANVNFDSVVNATDAILIMRHVLGIESF